jgi:hypothetical protein
MKLPAFLAAASLLAASAFAQPPGLTADDRAAIQALMGSYARALGECRAADFANLFAPETGWFASGFRGHIVGRERLVKLVESERHCVALPGAGAARSGGNGPTVEIEPTPTGARGVANLGTAEYQDEYVKTPAGWRFASRTVIVAPEKAAGIDARELQAIMALAGSDAADYYEADQKGAPRFLTAGVRVTVAGTEVTGRVFRNDGSFDDQVYEKVGPGNWRVKSSVHGTPAGTR